jgi:hypothetical protein
LALAERALSDLDPWLERIGRPVAVEARTLPAAISGESDAMRPLVAESGT